MRLTFSTTGKSFSPGNSSEPDVECFGALKVEYARRVREAAPWIETQQVVVDLNTDQAQALVDQLLHDYPYLQH